MSPTPLGGPSLPVGRGALIFTIMALLWGGAARPLAAQSESRYQVDLIAAYTFPDYVYGTFILYTDREVAVLQMEDVKASLAVTRVTPLRGRLAARYGLHLADKGYQEERWERVFATNQETTETRDIRFLYLGVPVLLGFNTANARPGLKWYAEVGAAVDVRIHQTTSWFYDWDLGRVGGTYVAGTGLKLNLKNGQSVQLGVDFRRSAWNYGSGAMQAQIDHFPDYWPNAIGVLVGVQF